LARVTQDRRELALVLAEAVGWLALTLDAARQGRIGQWEERWTRAPAPAPMIAHVVSRAGSPETLRVGVIALAMLRASRGQPISGQVGRVLAAALLRRHLSRLVARPRPPESWWQATPDGWSYPSRHTTNAGLLVRFALDGAVHPSTGNAAYWTTAAVVGASRVRLGVHWPTDVLGAALGTDLWWRLTGFRHRRTCHNR
jgi:undecaprenyl-diphosphatase